MALEWKRIVSCISAARRFLPGRDAPDAQTAAVVVVAPAILSDIDVTDDVARITVHLAPHMKRRYGGEFTGELFQHPGQGGWIFVPVPDKYAPPVTHAWGRAPVRATVDGHSWDTSVWRDKSGRTLLAVPKRVRGTKGHADKVRVRIEFNAL